MEHSQNINTGDLPNDIKEFAEQDKKNECSAEKLEEFKTENVEGAVERPVPFTEEKLDMIQQQDVSIINQRSDNLAALKTKDEPVEEATPVVEQSSPTKLPVDTEQTRQSDSQVTAQANVDEALTDEQSSPSKLFTVEPQSPSNVLTNEQSSPSQATKWAFTFGDETESTVSVSIK